MKIVRRFIPFATIFICIALISLLIFFVTKQNFNNNDDEIPFLIGITQPNLNEPWRIEMNEEIKSEASKYEELHVIFTDSAQNSYQQKLDIEKLLDYGIDLLIVSVDDAATLTPTITEAYKKIPVIVLGRGVTGYDYTLYIGSDHELIGKKLGDYVDQLIGKTEGAIIEIQGDRESPTVIERKEGLLQIMSSHPNLKLTNTIYANWQRDEAEDKLLKLLENGNQPDLVFAHNDAMAVGAYRALKKLQLKDVQIIGIDAVNAENSGLQMIRTGAITGTINSPTGGKEAVQYALDILKKEIGIPKKIILKSKKITKDNVNEYLEEQRERKYEKFNIENLKEEITLGFIQVGNESNWRLAHTKSVITAANEAGINLKYENADQDQDKQIEFIRSFIKQGVDVIALSPKVETGWDDILKEAKQAGIPVILSDREIRVEDDSLWTAYIGSDFEEEGRRAARWLVSTHKGEQKKVIEIQGTEQSAPAVGRNQGFIEVLEQHVDFKIIETLKGDFTFDAGRKLMEKSLQKYGSDIDVVYAHNDDMALGAIKAIEKYGLKPGEDIITISIDATKDAFRALSAGKLNLAVECNPLLGPQIMKAVKDIMIGKDIPLKFITSEGVFTQESAQKNMPKREY
ncbi:substrate-binding domain-containing protein [Bacillus sp. FSL K6-3431]|uniref:substrate-binding domain-containing protein n=1 Tax=Bacillus sp. FSL K6-3431 TaxID=2921500 RepID=UPI0030F5A9D0